MFIGSKRAVGLVAIAIAALCGSTSVSAQVRQFDVPSEDAGKSIPEFARQAQIQVIAPGDQLHGVITPPIKGPYDIFVALDLMLKGTGLKVVRSAEGIVRISLLDTKMQGEKEDVSTKLKSSTSILALLFGIVAGGTAEAQSVADGVETVTVSGIRKSIQDAIDTKRGSGVILDSISAQDIGKLPDQNIAETLSRIPGVQITRMEGQGAAISVRGINLNKVELNGQNFVGSAADGAPKLADIAPELLASAEVIKSPSADQPEGWLGAIINLKTKRPLDFSEPVYAGRLSGTYSDHIDAGGGKGSAFTANQFFGGTLGVLFGASFSDEAGRTDQYASGGWTRTTTDANGDGIPDTFAMPVRLQEIVDIYRNKDLALNSTVQWRPTADWNVVLDGFYSRLDTSRILTGSQAVLSPTSVTNGTILSDGTLSSGTFGNVTYRPLVYGESGWSSSNALSLVADYTHGPWQAHFSVSQSQGNGLGHDGLTTDVSGTGNQNVLVVRQISGNTVNIPYSLGANSVSPNFSLKTNFNVLDPSQYEIYNTFDATYPISNKGRDISADTRYELNWWMLKAFKVGARVENVAIYSGENLANFPSLSTYDPTPATSLRVTEVPGLNYGRTITNYLGGVGGSFPQTLLSGVPEPAAWRTFLHATGPDMTSLTALSALAQVHQQTNAAYAKVEFADNLAGIPFDGDAGLRWVDTHRGAFGYTIAGTAAIPTRVARDFDMLLPSANLVLHPSEQFDIRFDAAKVTARPPLNLTGVQTLLSGVSNTGNAGNPNLKPFAATQFDASAEWYFGPASTLSLAVFTKNVSAFTQIVTLAENHPELPSTGNGSIQYLVSRPTNGSDGTVSGYEINYQHALNFLPEPFDGFGYQLTYTHSDSRTPNVDELTGKPLPIPYASKHSANAILYYEKDGISARIAYNYRSAFLVAQQPASLGGSLFGDGRGQWDMSASYDLSDTYKLTFEGVNLGNNVNRFYVGDKNRIFNAFIDDTRYYLGIAATF